MLFGGAFFLRLRFFEVTFFFNAETQRRRDAEKGRKAGEGKEGHS